MKLFFNALFICLSSLELTAQTVNNQANWQQRANFVMDVRLNTQTRSVEGALEMTYFNNSPGELSELYIHVWPNAYKNLHTPFANQQLRNGKVDFEFFTEEQRGHISQLEFNANGKKLKWGYFPAQEDIVYVTLTEPLKQGQSITINTPFTVKLPNLISRSGVEGSFYAVTQWYPKPAVYDVNGWHPMSYLDQGEFYSEYGEYDVRITVPDSMTVAATGNMIEFKDTAGLKTYRFIESNIHDFAWFASSRFSHVKKSINLDDSSKVLLEVYGNKLDYIKSVGGLKDLDSAVRLYSKLVGKYPYKTCKLVVGNLKAGEGMEYPTITLCKDLSSETVIHEVGHNWFYGILGSDERAYPWMDESINTYFHKRITNHCDTFQCREIKPNTNFYGKISFRKWISQHASLLGYKAIAAHGLTQSINLPSEYFTSYNYGAMLYGKGPMAFAYLQQQLGDSIFLKCFQNYFNEWQFKHPLPGDIQKSFEQSSGRNLSWFFDDVLNDNNDVDVREKRGKYIVEGVSHLDSLIDKNPLVHPNPNGFLIEKNYFNNGQKKGLLGFHFPFALPSYNKHLHVNLTPFMGYNIYDGLYPVLVVNNSIMNQRSFEYTFVPGYSFKEKRFNGYGRMVHTSRLKGSFDRLEIGVQSQMYGLETSRQDNRYYRVQPFVKLRFKNPLMKMEARKQFLMFSFTHTGLERNHYMVPIDTIGNIGERRFSRDYFFNYSRLQYGFDNGDPINRKAINFTAEYAQNNKFGPGTVQYVKTWMNAVFKYQYKKKKFLRSELFAGAFLHTKGQFENQKFFISSNSGNRDYLYSDALLGRNELRYGSTTIFGKQLINRGGLRQLVDLESSDRWMVTLNSEIDFPGALPFSFYLDLGLYKYMHRVNNANVGLQMDFCQTGGIQINMFRRTLEVFVPVFSSSQFRKFNMINSSFLNTIGFRLNLNQLNPIQMISNAAIYGKTGVGSQP